MVNRMHQLFTSYSTLMSAQPRREPLVSSIYKDLPNGTQLHASFPHLRFDEAVYVGEKPWVLDYTVSSTPLCTSDVAAAEDVPFRASEEKKTHYSARLPQSGTAKLGVLAFSSFGRISLEGLDVLRSVARSLTRSCESMYPLVLHQMLATLSVAIWKGNAGIITNHLRHQITGA